MPRSVPAHVITDDSALGGSVIERSLRFNDGDSSYLQFTPSSTGNRKTWTWSSWIKRGKVQNSAGGSSQRTIFHSYGSGDQRTELTFEIDDTLKFQQGTSSDDGQVTTTAKFRDTNGWYHIVCVADFSNGTAGNRFKIYVNGVEQANTINAAFADADGQMPVSGVSIDVGGRVSNRFFNGYMAEVNFVDGQALSASYFGYTENQTGLWRPKKYEGTYGTNGFYLDFSDNTSTSTLGIDKSPNGNDFGLNNIATTDSLKDTPTDAFATLNINVYADANFKEGNLYFDSPDTHKTAYSNIAVSSGKWYWETKAMSASSTKWTYGVDDVKNIGVGQISGSNRLLAVEPSAGYANGDSVSIYNTKLYKNGSVVTDSYQTAVSSGDIIGVALDVDAGKVWFARNGTWINGSATASTTLNPASHDITVTTGETYVPAISGESADWQLNFGQDDSFSGTSTSQGNKDENNLGSFYYAVPSGFKALHSKNLPKTVPSVIRQQKHFDTLLYTATGNAMTVTGLEFKPDLIWQKRRDSTGGSHFHYWFDSIRGGRYVLQSNTDGTESDSGDDNNIVFKDGGFDMAASDGGQGNAASGTYVAWCWKAGGAAVANTDGTLNSQVSVNEEAGFSIVSWTSTGTTGSTIGHGLSKKPDWIILKGRNTSENQPWRVYHTYLGATKSFQLETSGTPASQTGVWNDTEPTSSVFTVGNFGSTNENTKNYIAYCWTPIPGYSKFGSYTGNGNADGPFVHLGFRPAWLMLRRTDSGDHFIIKDSTRNTINDVYSNLGANLSNAEFGSAGNVQSADFLANGFKIKGTDSAVNSSSGTYAYMAFAEQPGNTAFDTFPNAR